jgi:ubiquinone/menaquinone biosynthesis C-methylase UbiE
MVLYQKFILPKLIDYAMKDKSAVARRSEVIPRAMGNVLEVGIDSGLNLPFYSSTVSHVLGVDPSPELLTMARQKIDALTFPVELVRQSAEQLPLVSGSIDTVVTTWTLSSIGDPVKALREMKRVLKSEGRLLFIEHGAAPDQKVQAWQRRINPIWRKFAGGCNLNRRIDKLITSAGFIIAKLQTTYLPGHDC